MSSLTDPPRADNTMCYPASPRPTIDDMLLDMPEEKPYTGVLGERHNGASNSMHMQSLPDLERLRLDVRDEFSSHVTQVQPLLTPSSEAASNIGTANEHLPTQHRPQLRPHSVAEKLERIRAQYAAHRSEQQSIDVATGLPADSDARTAQSPIVSSPPPRRYRSRHFSPPRGPKSCRIDHYYPPRADKSTHYCPSSEFCPEGISWARRMADHRNGGPRGRGHYNQNNNRKRRYNDREDDSYDNRPQNRRRYDAPPGSRLRNNMIRLVEGDKEKAEDDLKYTAKIATDHYNDEYVRNVYWDSSLQLISEQPCKIVFVAAVARYANKDQPELVKTLLEKIAQTAQRQLEAGQWTPFKHTLRFLACIQDLFVDQGVFVILRELFERTIDLQSESQDDVVGLELVKIILLTIPYAIASGASGLEADVKDLLEKTEIVASAPHAQLGLVEPYHTTEGSVEQPACPTALSCLQAQLQNEATNGWPLKCIPRFPAQAMKSEANGDDAEMKAEPTRHKFPALIVPSPVNQGSRTLFPEVFFSMFAGQEAQSVPQLTDIASSLMRDSVVDTINLYHVNRMVAAKYLLDLDHYWAAGTFAKRATPLNKLKDVPEGKSTWKTEDVAIDAMFSQIMLLPAPQHKLVYYHSVLTALLQLQVPQDQLGHYHPSVTDGSKAAASAIAPSLGRAIRFLFKHVEVLDLELQYRFLDWFAHHLSNFEFRWKWNEWLDEINLNTLHPKRVFIVSALDKEIRLSFAKRVNDAIPADWQAKHIITEQQKQEQPKFKYEDDKTPFAKQGLELATLLRKKNSVEEEVDAVIKSIESEAQAQGVSDPLVISTDVFVTSVCHTGSKSLSHVLSTIDKSKVRLLAIGPASEVARRQIITSVSDYWQHQPGTAVNIIDKLLNYTIITPMSVIQWALGDKMDKGRTLANTMSLELVSATMQKVANRVRQIVAARNDPSLLEAEALTEPQQQQKAAIEETLGRERQVMKEYFATILDAVQPVADGSQDEMIEAYSDGADTRADDMHKTTRLLKAWGSRWVKLWSRKLAVEDAYSTPEAVEAQAKVIRAQGRVEREIAEAEAAQAAALALAQEEKEKARDAARAAREAERRREEDARNAEAATTTGAAENGGGKAENGDITVGDAGEGAAPTARPEMEEAVDMDVA